MISAESLPVNSVYRVVNAVLSAGPRFRTLYFRFITNPASAKVCVV